MTTTSEQPVAGSVPTRDERTCASYRARAKWLTERAAKELSIQAPSPQEVAAHLLTLRPTISTATWRQYKSALLFAWQERGDAMGEAAVAMLRHEGQSECLRTTNRTSGKRAKGYDDAELQQVLDAIKATSSKFAGLLATWVQLGNVVGVRPHEWCISEVIQAHPNEVGDLDFEGDGGALVPYLRIRNAKRSNGRTHGEFRHLNLADLPPGMVRVVTQFAKKMSQLAEAGLYEATCASCTKLLQRVNQSLHSNNDARWIQLYSPRHKFTSKAKLHLSQAQAAALLGHATTRTAEVHYGKRRSASGSLGVKPVALEVERVRKVRGYQAAAIAKAGAGPKAGK